MLEVLRLFVALLKGEDGATMVEYAIMLVLIAAVSMLVITTIGTDIRGLFESVDF